MLRDALGERLAAARWSVMAHNVESLIWQRYTETGDEPAEAVVHPPAVAEVRAVRALGVLRRDRADRRQPRRRRADAATSSASSRVSVVENGVDVDYFRPQRDVERDPARMLFLGSLDWRPNLDAAAQLLDDIFPRSAPLVPHATRGRSSAGTRRSGSGAGARRRPAWSCHADVPDVRPFLARCGMLVVPLRIGGGSRLKILEALAAGTPVVSTRVGAEGLDLTAGRDLAR